ncbi:hypothetical protein DdX_04849 [Ditylenchus destructor]|uniref:Uncharacterized protein n=1 Tax=Ditylenchus destructor TaxID=166010 RepID=A0AAD4R749_9BILA|nr:hypothetical protein DdX_04849 [Ditylenchus destructor]
MKVAPHPSNPREHKIAAISFQFQSITNRSQKFHRHLQDRQKMGCSSAYVLSISLDVSPGCSDLPDPLLLRLFIPLSDYGIKKKTKVFNGSNMIEAFCNLTRSEKEEVLVVFLNRCDN